MAGPLETISKRKNRVLNTRGEQIAINLLALDGGRPYVEARLSRFPGEAEVQWSGKNIAGGITQTTSRDKDHWPTPTPTTTREITGRRDRAYNVNYIRRISEKLNQYVFQVPPKRDNISEDFAQDVNTCGWPIDRYWRRVSSILTAGGWCWVSADSTALPVDETGNPLMLSAAQKTEFNIRPYWSIWTPNEVVDWSFGAGGELLWLLTEQTTWEDSDPEQEARKVKMRTLWKPGEVTRYLIKDKTDNLEVVEVPNPPASIPFVPVGNISDCPHWMDDAETIQRAILDMTSANHECMFRQIYGQLVMPAGSVNDLASSAGMSYDEAVDALVGLSYALTEDADTKGISRYITPSAADLGILRQDINEAKKALFEVVGFAMRPESRQVESAEAKLFDHLDVQAVLKERSRELEEVETKLVEITKELDPNFQEYEPDYSKTFDVGDFESEVKAYLGLNGMDAPAAARKELGRAAFKKARDRGYIQMDDAEWEDLMREFDEMESEPLTMPAPVAEPTE